MKDYNERYSKLTNANNQEEESVSKLNDIIETELKQYTGNNYTNKELDIAKHFFNFKLNNKSNKTVIAHVFGKEGNKSLYCFKIKDNKPINHEIEVIIKTE